MTKGELIRKLEGFSDEIEIMILKEIYYVGDINENIEYVGQAKGYPAYLLLHID